MSETTVERRSAHVRGVTVTAIASLFGVAAGVLSMMYATGPQDPLGPIIMGGAIFAQLPVLKLLGIDVEEFSPKDSIYVGFMTFCLWFVSWGILLSSNASVSL